jgi:hypothetical protein
MSFTHWLSNCLGLSPRPASWRTAPAARRTVRPCLERLEDRWVLSTLTVLNNLDSGAGSLRADIAAAHNGDTIVFASTLVGGQTITLTSGELLIKKNLTIAGPGAGELTVSGHNASRVFEVASKENVTLSGLTISNGLAAIPSRDNAGRLPIHSVIARCCAHASLTRACLTRSGWTLETTSMAAEPAHDGAVSSAICSSFA